MKPSKFDAIATHKVWGYVIFLAAMWLMFLLTFELGAYPMGWIEQGVGALGAWVGSHLAPGPVRDLMVEGIIGGVGSVIVFLPNIVILFLCISLMEESGYMARAALVMDRPMRAIGLGGRSFIPMIMGFGCNVPGIMAAQNISNRSSRIITVMVAPFMSCSARLPIYILLVGTFFPRGASLVLVGIYVIGIVVAALTALVMRRVMFRGEEDPYFASLPPYRVPTAKATLMDMWRNSREYLKKMGGVILAASILVWGLSYYPRPEPGMTAAEQREHSYLGRVGQFVEPVMSPLGIPWKGSVALVAGIGAKESTVSTLGVLYSTAGSEDAGGEDLMASLPARLSEPDPETGEADWTPLAALSFMIFALLYFPCPATLAAIRKETGGGRWVVASVVYSTLIAWGVAWGVYNVGLLII